MRAVDQKERKIKPLYLHKKPRYRERRMWEQPPPNQRVSLQFLTCQHRPPRGSFPQNNDQLCCTETGGSTDGSESKLAARALFLSPHTSTWGWQPPLPSDWLRLVWRGKKNGSQKKCVESRQCAHRSVRGSDTPVKWGDKMWFHRVYLSLANRRAC